MLTMSPKNRGKLQLMTRITFLFLFFVGTFCLLFLFLPAVPAEPSNVEAVLETPVPSIELEYDKERARIEKLVSQENMTVLVQAPFIVVGDEAPAVVKQRTNRTVKWAVEHLKDQYFEKDPDHIIAIWLLKDSNSYYKHAKQFFGDDPSTPFGYYSPSDKAMVMNIETGGGTLVHEIVHPFGG
jgi:hypothetical protein